MKDPRMERYHPLVVQTFIEYIPFTKHRECNGEQNKHGCSTFGVMVYIVR